MLSTSVKPKASIEMGWLRWWNPQADQNGELFSQRLNEVNIFYLALVPKTSWLRSTFTWEYENLDAAVLWGQVLFGADGQCEFWRPLVVPCFKWHDWNDVHSSNLSRQGLGKIIFQQLPAFRTVLVPVLACINLPQKPCRYYGRRTGVGLVLKSCLELFSLFWGGWTLVKEFELCHVS